MAEAPGGLLRFGIPNFKLNITFIDRRIRLMEEEGIVFQMDTYVDTDSLPVGFDAYCLCTGAPVPRDLPIPGRELKGIHFALEMLAQQNRLLAGQEIPKDIRVNAKGKRVLVIGGGDTGSDCIGTSVRQGAKSVTQIEIMPMPPTGHNDATPWPQWPIVLKTTSSHEEGCTRRWSLSSTRFLGDDGQVTGVEVEEVDWIADANGGRPTMKPTGRKEVIAADLVLLAMGFLKPQLPTLPKGVFTAGDITLGPSLVVKAMGAGKAAAEQIDKYIQAT
jgi:glutamate synthase (NADPH/NADH) small chain